MEEKITQRNQSRDSPDGMTRRDVLKMVVGAGSIVALRQIILEFYKRLNTLTAPAPPTLTTHDIAMQTVTVQRQSMAYVGRLSQHVDVVMVQGNGGRMRCALVPAGQALSPTMEAKVVVCAIDGNSILLSTVRSQPSVEDEKHTVNNLLQTSLWTTEEKKIHSQGSVEQMMDAQATGNLQIVAVRVPTQSGGTHLTPAIAIEALSIGDVVDVCQFTVWQLGGDAPRPDHTMFIVARKRNHDLSTMQT